MDRPFLFTVPCFKPSQAGLLLEAFGLLIEQMGLEAQSGRLGERKRLEGSMVSSITLLPPLQTHLIFKIKASKIPPRDPDCYLSYYHNHKASLQHSRRE